MFGINTFLGTILKSIISLIFADKRGLALEVHSQVKQAFNPRSVLHKQQGALAVDTDITTKLQIKHDN